MTRWYALLLLAVVCLAGRSACARLVVNEVLSNEPQAYTGLEWIELYNDGIGVARLTFYQIDADGTLLTLTDSVLPHSYLVICRKLVGIPASPGFEDWWGNSSGVWGDTPQENFRVVEATFTLTNGSGSVTATYLGTTESTLSWGSAGADGVSWERVAPPSVEIAPSVAPSGSTPGGANSLAPLARDLSLDSLTVSYKSGITTVTCMITSRSVSTVTGASLLIYFVDPLDSNNTSAEIELVDLPPVDTGFTTAVVREITLPGSYAHLGALLSVDDRAYNNRRTRIVPGQQFPPVALSEFLANPESGLATEWVELFNREDTTVSLAAWKIGDSAGLAGPFGPITIPARSYLVVAADTSAFRQFYSGFSGDLTHVAGFPSFNNTGDLIRLMDPNGYEADRFAYSETYPENFTWGKSEIGNRWGKSSESGGSPGEVNDLRFTVLSSALRVAISPRLVSPDNDGIDDTALIVVEAPKAIGYTVRIYSSDGQLVRGFEDKSSDFSNSYVWDGHDESGRRLPVGIYIVYVEAVGVESIKKTVVLAR